MLRLFTLFNLQGTGAAALADSLFSIAGSKPFVKLFFLISQKFLHRLVGFRRSLVVLADSSDNISNAVRFVNTLPPNSTAFYDSVILTQIATGFLGRMPIACPLLHFHLF